MEAAEVGLDQGGYWELTVNDVGFVIPEEDLALGLGSSLDHSRVFV